MAEFHDEMANVAWAEKPEGEKAIHFLKSLVKTFAPQKATELLKYLDRIRKSQKWYGS